MLRKTEPAGEVCVSSSCSSALPPSTLGRIPAQLTRLDSRPWLRMAEPGCGSGHRACWLGGIRDCMLDRHQDQPSLMHESSPCPFTPVGRTILAPKWGKI